MSANQRKNERIFVDEHLAIFDPLRRRQIGYLGNISWGGLLLCSRERLRGDLTPYLWIRLPDGLARKAWIPLSATVVWERWSPERGAFEYGLLRDSSSERQIAYLLELLMESADSDNNGDLVVAA